MPRPDSRAVELYFELYNFVGIHKMLRATPTTTAWSSDGLWSMEGIAALIEAAASKLGRRGSYKERERGMTKGQLRNNVIGAGMILLLAFVAAVTAKFVFANDAIYTAVKDFSSLIIAIVGAYLAFCFQRRQAFLSALRELWRELIDAKTEIVAYTYIENPDIDDYQKAYKALSRAIDTVRGVFLNIGENEGKVGYYPFEPLHDMRKSLERIGSSNWDQAVVRVERERIMSAWNALRWSFLTEFVRSEPMRPITTYDASDPRRRHQTPN